jgi:hypothetical protein
MAEVPFTSPAPMPVLISSPGLVTWVRTGEAKMDEEQKEGREVLLKSHC